MSCFFSNPIFSIDSQQVQEIPSLNSLNFIFSSFDTSGEKQHEDFITKPGAFRKHLRSLANKLAFSTIYAACVYISQLSWIEKTYPKWDVAFRPLTPVLFLKMLFMICTNNSCNEATVRAFVSHLLFSKKGRNHFLTPLLLPCTSNAPTRYLLNPR